MATTQTEFAIAEASILPMDLVNAVIWRVERLPAEPSHAEVMDVAACISQGHAGRAALVLLLKAWWEERSEISRASLCLALRAACNAAAIAREAQRCELAWSGPDIAHSRFRRTDSVSAEVIDSARERLWMATYSISGSDLMISRLAEAKRRGVTIHLLVEHPHYITNNREGIRAFRDLGVAPMTWRPDLRPAGGKSSFHPKCIVADDSMAFVTSANLSVAAHERNIETGVLITGGELPRQLAARFASLLIHGMLEAI